MCSDTGTRQGRCRYFFMQMQVSWISSYLYRAISWINIRLKTPSSTLYSCVNNESSTYAKKYVFFTFILKNFVMQLKLFLPTLDLLQMCRQQIIFQDITLSFVMFFIYWLHEKNFNYITTLVKKKYLLYSYQIHTHYDISVIKYYESFVWKWYWIRLSSVFFYLLKSVDTRHTCATCILLLSCGS